VDAPRLLSPAKAKSIAEQLPYCEQALASEALSFFVGRLPCGHRLRVLPTFSTHLTYLDVETDGLHAAARITMIGAHTNGESQTFIRGHNLQDFIPYWQNIAVLATYNGKAFDVPIITREFGFAATPPHIDLMHEARHWGLRGGLKAIERHLGLRREKEEEGDGANAVKLWRDYIENDDHAALKRLEAYNLRDVLSLQDLSQHLWNRSADGYPGPLPKVGTIAP
jgi:uncharacterized protein YprB with RNaseH-like and TPR domain